MKTFWITKYALSKGVFSIEAEVFVANPTTSYARGVGLHGLFCRIGKDAFESEAEALADAIRRAKAKRIALSRMSSKLTDLVGEWQSSPCMSKETKVKP